MGNLGGKVGWEAVETLNQLTDFIARCLTFFEEMQQTARNVFKKGRFLFGEALFWGLLFAAMNVGEVMLLRRRKDFVILLELDSTIDEWHVHPNLSPQQKLLPTRNIRLSETGLQTHGFSRNNATLFVPIWEKMEPGKIHILTCC